MRGPVRVTARTAGFGFFASCATLFAAACSGSSSDSGPSDSGRCAKRLPPPSDPCLAGCGNEIGVGQPCEQGTGACADNGLMGAFVCTIDVARNTELAFCTRPCSTDDHCGSGAVCRGDPEDPSSGKGCVPIACVGPEDVDGGGGDAGAGDLGADASSGDAGAG